MNSCMLSCTRVMSKSDMSLRDAINTDGKGHLSNTHNFMTSVSIRRLLPGALCR
jgi:hypothetical protein